ncbi:unnamed protein product [Arabidopsis thaliana]|uniref:(thale cress) hypothetical protein n=1 Tax=Arabidopsis thaliana TaxID=3702 RepID=A0A7G2DXK8_ARATH|nr:unnamed protein product [Arabidopsis thaliana]
MVKSNVCALGWIIKDPIKTSIQLGSSGKTLCFLCSSSRGTCFESGDQRGLSCGCNNAGLFFGLPRTHPSSQCRWLCD